MSEFGCCQHQHQYGICDCPRHQRSDLHPMGTVMVAKGKRKASGEAS